MARQVNPELTTFLWILIAIFFLVKTVQIVGWIIDSYDYEEGWSDD